MHPGERGAHDEEQQHEAAGPQSRQVEQGAKGDRQHKTAEAADHADKAADRSDVFRIIDGYVFVDGGLAERHEEAKHKDCDDEALQAHFHVKRRGAMRGSHDVIGGRIRQDEGAKDSDEEGPIHDRARAIAVGQMAAIGAKQAGGQREHSRGHAGRLQIDAVNFHQILRQPQRQGDKTAEDEEIIKRKAPDLDVFQQLQLQPGAARLFAGAAAFGHHGVLPCGEPEHNRHQGQAGGPDVGDALPTPGDHHEGRTEFGDGGADIPGAENAERGSLLAGGIPARDIGNSDRKRAAGDADAKRRDQELRVSLRESEKISREGSGQHDECEDAATAVLVGPHAQGQTHQRSRQDRRADQQAELRLVEPEVLLDLNAYDGEDRPDRKA